MMVWDRHVEFCCRLLSNTDSDRLFEIESLVVLIKIL